MRKNMTRRDAVCVLGIAAATTLVGCTSQGSIGAGKPSSAESDSAKDAQKDTPTTDTAGDSTAGSDTSSNADPTPEPAPDPAKTAVQNTLASMTLEQKVAQLFFVTPESLTGVEAATVAGSLTSSALANLPVGGMIYFARNITGNDQLRALLSGTVEMSRNCGAGIAVFTGVDEEGGKLVARIANSGYFDVQTFPNMREIGDTGDVSQAANVGTTIGTYLHDIGFSVDFAPDADVLTNPDNTAIGPRSFGSDAQVVSQMVSAEVSAMITTQTMPCAKHFPGHGDTAGDSHTGAAISNRSMDDLVACEFLPFSAAISAGCPMIMVGHIQTPNAAADGLPASLSPKMITDVLRGQLGYNGIVISDAMNMGAITEYYTPAQAATAFLLAGGDMILMPDDLLASYQGVIDAIGAGTLTEARINESVERILTAKQTACLI